MSIDLTGGSFSTGVLAGLTIPYRVNTVVDRAFFVPFSLDVDQPASLYVGFGDNGIGGSEGGSKQVIFDFADDIYFFGPCGSSLLLTRDQGLTLTSVTLEDGTPLENVGLKFGFILENTVLSAAASAFDAGPGIGLVGNSVIAASAPCGKAQVFLPKAVATAKLKGGSDLGPDCGNGVTTDALLDLDVNPEPDPLVFDLAYATVSGANNIKLTRISSANTPPIANAGENLTITSEEQCDTVIHGTASDPDNDPLEYRWLEGGTEIFPWAPVGPNGAAQLDLCTIGLGLGQHTLILEVSDGEATSRDDMILTIDNSAPHAAPTGGGVYQIGTPITVGGQVSDFDGDGLTYTWSEGTTTYCNGSVQSMKGGTPVSLPGCALPHLGLGTHIVTLTVSDRMNEPVARNVTINVVDTTAPTLAPVSNVGILWPPNHKMVDIIIQANAHDESGHPPTLSAVVTSNEPQEGLGDGDMTPDWTAPVINQATGVITLQLRAERSGLGNGRIYTVSITATDEAGNTSTAKVEIIVPHDQSATQ